MSVNKPTNPKLKEQDVNRKLQLFGIYEAFSNGKCPSNQQIDVALNSALASRALAKPSTRLSAEGKVLVADLRDVIEKAKLLLLTKNEGELLQDFIWRAQHIDGGSAKGATIAAPTDKEVAKQHGNQALDGLRTLGTLLLSNGQFRKLLSDATVLLRDIVGDGAQKAAEKVNPHDERLATIDQPAPDNTWHDVPDLSKDNIRNTAKEQYNKTVGVQKEDVKAAAATADKTNDPNAASAELQNRSNISEEDKSRLQQAKDVSAERTKQYLQEKMPKERREQTIWRLKKMLVEIQGHQDYQNAINTLLYLAETYTGHAKNVVDQTTGTVKTAHTSDDSLTAVESDLKQLLERFANYTSSEDLFDAINNIYLDADRDPELKNWFKHLDTYIRACLKEQGYVLTDRANDEANQLEEQGRFLLRERYRDHVDRIVDEFKFLGDQFDADPANKAFGNSVQKLFLDLGNDKEGKPTFKPHLIKDLTEVIVPAFFENLSYVPLPRIEYSDPMIDAIVENLIIESDNLFPNELEVQSDNYFKWGRKKVASRNKNKFRVAMSGVQMDLRDVSYYIHKKSGFPSIKDKGVMDIFMGGSGFSFDVALETADTTDRHHFFKVNKVKVDIKNLKLKLKQSNHKLLFNIFKPTLMGIVKPALTKIIEKQIKESIEKGDRFFYDIKLEADKAEREVKENPENAPNVYKRYYDSFQRKVAEGKKKTEDVTSDKKANVAMTQHDSIFQNIKLPGGISTKATEYKELAAKGERWQSPIFGIGSASASSSLPKATSVTRKPHQTARGELRAAKGPTPYSDGTSHLGGNLGKSTNGATGTSSVPATTTSVTNGAGAGTTLGSEMDAAFKPATAGAPAAAIPASTIPATTTGAAGVPGVVSDSTGHTTLGANNPVLRGA